MYEANELNEALKIIESIDGCSVEENIFSSGSKVTLNVFDDIPKNVS